MSFLAVYREAAVHALVASLHLPAFLAAPDGGARPAPLMDRPAASGTGPSTIRLTLLGKPDCHLCHEMRDLVRHVLGEGGALILVEKNVAEDPDLERRYLFEIPVLLAGEREIARYPIEEAELRTRLAALHLLP